MRQLKIFIIIVCGFLFGLTNKIHAQNRLPAPTVKNPESIRGYVQSDYFNIDKKFLFNTCTNIVVYAKFKITHTGKIDSLDISSNSPIEISQALKHAIMASDGLWVMTAYERKHINDKTFLLPVICCYQAGCYPGLVTDSILSQRINTKLNSKDQMRESVQNILKFEKSSYRTLNCILIEPVFLGIMQ